MTAPATVAPESSEFRASDDEPLTFDDVEITLEAEFEQDVAPEDSFASGDEATDAAFCDEIRRRLDNGDVWAWCCVTVKATWRGYVGYATLGGCCYADENDFRKGDYFEDMRNEALDNLNDLLRERLADLVPALEVRP